VPASFCDAVQRSPPSVDGETLVETADQALRLEPDASSVPRGPRV